MPEPFRVALSGDFKTADGSPTYPDFDLTPLRTAPHVEMAFLEPLNPKYGGFELIPPYTIRGGVVQRAGRRRAERKHYA